MTDNQEELEATVRPIQFGPLDSAPAQVTPPASIDLLRDVPLTVTAELGRTKMVVKEILKLGVGSVIELEKLTGEPVDILVNGKVIARGEVVAVGENFGVRIAEVVGR